MAGSLASAPISSPAVSDTSDVQVIDISKVFVRREGRDITRTRALDRINLAASGEEFVSIIGPSGCGKSTLLRILAGLIPPSSGEVVIRGRKVVGPSSDRAMVFQSPGLMPWLRVMGNMLQALEFAGVPKREREERASRYLELVGLWDFRNYYPSELSGGMQQRVGLARALAVEPKVLLMDEPFASLDAIARERMQQELLRLWDYERRPVFFVTHSIDEALLLSDRVVVMSNGAIVDTVQMPFRRPRRLHELLEMDDFVEIRKAIASRLVGE